MGADAEVDVVLVYGGFTVPGYGVNFIVLSYSSGRVPWAKEILPAVARLVQPWFPKVETRRIVRRRRTPQGTTYWRETVHKPPSLRKVIDGIYVDATMGSTLRSTKTTRRYVWDKKLEEDTSP